MLVETEFKKLEKFDAAYFRGKNYFDGDGTQNYLVFQPVYKYFERVGNDISSWESKGFSNEKISYMSFATCLIYLNARLKVKFNGDFLRQKKAIYNHGPMLNICIVYRLIHDTKETSITLENCPFGALKLTKNADIDKFKCSRYGVGCDSKISFSHPTSKCRIWQKCYYFWS